MAYYLNAVLLCLFIFAVVALLWWAYKCMKLYAAALEGNRLAILKMDESLGLSRRIVELNEETNSLLRKMLGKISS